MARGEKGAEEKGRTLLWVDESACYLLPSVVRTYAPKGKTPILRVPLTRDHLSAISGLTLDGDLYLCVQDRAYRGPDVVRFLEHLLRHIPNKLTILWDGAPIHRAKVVKEFLSKGGPQRIHLEQLPGYSPNSIQMRASGATSSGSNSGTYAAPTPGSFVENCGWPLLGYADAVISSRAVSRKSAMFRPLCSDQ